jgi:hypothetical protein
MRTALTIFASPFWSERKPPWGMFPQVTCDPLGRESSIPRIKLQKTGFGPIHWSAMSTLYSSRRDEKT